MMHAHSVVHVVIRTGIHKRRLSNTRQVCPTKLRFLSSLNATELPTDNVSDCGAITSDQITQWEYGIFKISASDAGNY